MNVNLAERQAQSLFKLRSVDYKRRGYPDFTIIKDDEIFGFIEVKPNQGKELRIDQKRFGRFCKRFGVPFMRWSPEDGGQAIDRFLAS